MQFLQKYRLWIAGAVVIVAGVALLSFGWQKFHPLPDLTTFKTRYYSFIYPREYDAQEYAPGVASIGHKNGEGLDPLVEVTQYKSDPDTALPKSFDSFIKLQASALCGADGSIESISCTEVGITPYTSVNGVAGQKLNLTLVRKNLKSGTTTSETYGPMYVFNNTSTEAPTPENPLRYSAIFIYPSLSAFINQATTSPALMDQIVSTFKLATTTDQ